MAGAPAVSVHVDARDYEQLARALNHLPGQIKAKAIARALSRVGEMARTQVVRRAAQQSGMPQRDVRSRTLSFNAGGTTQEIVMRSEWWPLYKLGGARQTKTGVTVRNWGHHRGAFIAGMRSGHEGVFRREGKSRLPIRELWGPNPVSFVLDHPDEYEAILAEVAETALVPRLVHELDRLLASIAP